jgi:hypothetical protein
VAVINQGGFLFLLHEERIYFDFGGRGSRSFYRNIRYINNRNYNKVGKVSYKTIKHAIKAN